MAVSRKFFTKERLSHQWARCLYLALYGTFKNLFEFRSLEKTRPFIRPGSVVLDIGANVGFTAAFFSHAVGPSGTVLAFEPDPIVADLFAYNIKRSGLNNVHLFPIALGDHDGEGILFQNLSNRADNRLYPDPGMAPDTERVAVPVRTLVKVAAEHPAWFQNVSFIKIDVQGYEANVFNGMAGWLDRLEHKPVILFEAWPYGLQKSGSSIDAVFARLNQWGYDIDSSVRTELMRHVGKDDYADIICIPSR